VQRQSGEGVAHAQVSGLLDLQRAVEERGRERPDRDDEDQRRARVHRGQEGGSGDDGEQEVRQDQPPGVLVQIPSRLPQGAARGHPFTPADAIPATK
jgi:hypothetical protein